MNAVAGARIFAGIFHGFPAVCWRIFFFIFIFLSFFISEYKNSRSADNAVYNMADKRNCI